MKLSVTKTITVPDPVKLKRFERSPDLGPRVLFFSGGTALRKLSGDLIRYTHNSIHLITPFDSGGSSAKLRDAFKMPAIGDIRNRLLALADRSLFGNPEIFSLFSHRFPNNDGNADLSNELHRMIQGRHPLVAAIPDPMRKIIRYYLQLFRKHMPETFDLRGASIGNLVIAGGYLDQRHLDPVIYIFSRLVLVRGIVRPVTSRYLHLVAEMEDGSLLVGQHKLTGKEVSPIRKKVKTLFLSAGKKKPRPAEAPIRNKVKDLIHSAELICYPMGSFYSSIAANLLPRGVGTAVSENSCPKVFIPNTGNDPELYGTSLTEQIESLLGYLRKDDPAGISPSDVLQYVILDENDALYEGGVDAAAISRLGVEVIRANLTGSTESPLLDETRLNPVLLSLV